MHALLQRGVGDAGRGEADALVDHLDAGIAGGDRDLLGTVAVAVEAGLADQHLEAAAEAGVGGVDLARAPAANTSAAATRAPGDAGGGAVLAEHLAQALAPLAGGDAGMGAGDRGRHDVAALAARRP